MTDQEKANELSAENKSSKPGKSEKNIVESSESRSFIVLFIIFFILLTLIIAGVSYYFWNRLQTLEAGVESATSGSTRQINANQASIQQLNTELDSLGKQQESLGDSVSELMKREPQGNEDWALEEIEYLLIIAMHRLLLEHDVATALAAMEAADRRLRDLRTPQVIPIREQIAADINKLHAVETVDVSGLAIYMADLIERAETLPLSADARISRLREQTDAPETADTDTGWRGFMSDIWAELKTLVVIKHEGEVSQALLLPDQEYFLYQNLRLELESARSAILRRDTANFHTSIELVSNWLQSYFDLSDPAVQNILDSLRQMSVLELDKELPDISSSLETLRAVIRQRENDNGADQ